MPTFPERLKARRERKELTQDQLAKAVGVSVRTIGNWEKGEPDPSLDILKLADVLGVTVGWLCGAEEEHVGELMDTGRQISLEDRTRMHLNKVLAACRKNPDRLAWVLIELERHLPIDPWNEGPPPVTYENPVTREKRLSALGTAAAKKGLEGLAKKQTSASTTGKKDVP